MEQNETPTRLFTVEEANRLLPRLRIMTAQLAEAHEHLLSAARELEALERQRTRSNALQLGRDLRAARERLGAAVTARRHSFDAITAEGVQIKNLEPALLDFPSWRHDRVVLLCWRAGEAAVGYWHPIDGGFASRTPI